MHADQGADQDPGDTEKAFNPIAKVCYKLRKASANFILVPEGELIYFFMTNLMLINTMAYGTGTY